MHPEDVEIGVPESGNYNYICDIIKSFVISDNKLRLQVLKTLIKKFIYNTELRNAVGFHSPKEKQSFLDTIGNTIIAFV
jgi:hypothetical protein